VLDVSEGRLRETLGEVGLDAELLNRDATTLSGGEKQRVTIARALVRDPHAVGRYLTPAHQVRRYLL
jgi:ABC-type dipeptide/oligopeptide/nickel transport system ATPase subunit